jgi:hypothetical protein
MTATFGWIFQNLRQQFKILTSRRELQVVYAHNLRLYLN